MTFVTAATFCNILDVSCGGYMTVALVIMDTPAIIDSIFLHKRSGVGSSWAVVKNALLDGTQLLLIGSLVIGVATSYITKDTQMLTGFISGDIFTGMMGFFLLHMGLRVGENLRDNLKQLLTSGLVIFAVITQWFKGALGLVMSLLFSLGAGDSLLVTILCASSNYIVIPTIIPYAIPDAKVGRFLSMSIGISFPVNILLGIPVWWSLCEGLIGI